MTLLHRAVHNRLFLMGLLLFVFGTGPLLVLIVAAKLGLTSDPNPNPIGLALLAMLTFWPSLIMMAAGVWKTYR